MSIIQCTTASRYVATTRRFFPVCIWLILWTFHFTEQQIHLSPWEEECFFTSSEDTLMVVPTARLKNYEWRSWRLWLKPVIWSFTQSFKRVDILFPLYAQDFPKCNVQSGNGFTFLNIRGAQFLRGGGTNNSKTWLQRLTSIHHQFEANFRHW